MLNVEGSILDKNYFLKSEVHFHVGPVTADGAPLPSSMMLRSSVFLEDWGSVLIGN